VTATKAQLTVHGTFHGLGAMLGIPGFIVAAVATSRSLRSGRVRDHAVRNATRGVIAAVVVFGLSMAMMFHGAPSTPDARIGIPNRILVASHAVWLIVISRSARRARR
jgi:hypothetical protein